MIIYVLNQIDNYYLKPVNVTTLARNQLACTVNSLGLYIKTFLGKNIKTFLGKNVKVLNFSDKQHFECITDDKTFFLYYFF